MDIARLWPNLSSFPLAIPFPRSFLSGKAGEVEGLGKKPPPPPPPSPTNKEKQQNTLLFLRPFWLWEYRRERAFQGRKRRKKVMNCSFMKRGKKKVKWLLIPFSFLFFFFPPLAHEAKKETRDRLITGLFLWQWMIFLFFPLT